jgi:nucleolar GTP-binding protein
LFAEKVLEKREAMAVSSEKRKKKLERDIEEEMGDDYILDLKKHYDLPEEFKYDVIPEIWEGKNIADYIDPHILKVTQHFSINPISKSPSLPKEVKFCSYSSTAFDSAET